MYFLFSPLDDWTAGPDSDLCEIRRETLAKFCPIKTSCVAVSVVEHGGMITGAKVPASPDPSCSLLHQMTPEMRGRRRGGWRGGGFNKRKTNTDKTRYLGIIFVIKFHMLNIEMKNE